jgi:hypothetical protein
VTRTTARLASVPLDPAIMSKIKLLELAVTGGHPPNADLDAQFPVSAAVAVNAALFGGLDNCLKPGTQVTVALLPEFASVPLGALLREAPSRKGGGFRSGESAVAGQELQLLGRRLGEALSGDDAIGSPPSREPPLSGRRRSGPWWLRRASACLGGDPRQPEDP